MGLSGTIITEHAVEQMAKRQIVEDDVRCILADPLEVLPVRTGRVVAHGIIQADAPEHDYLLRLFVDVDRQPLELVTA